MTEALQKEKVYTKSDRFKKLFKHLKKKKGKK